MKQRNIQGRFWVLIGRVFGTIVLQKKANSSQSKLCNTLSNGSGIVLLSWPPADGITSEVIYMPGSINHPVIKSISLGIDLSPSFGVIHVDRVPSLVKK